MELKGLIYDEVRLHAPHTEQLDGFVLQQSIALGYQMQLQGSEAVALLQMTPFAAGKAGGVENVNGENDV